jgi:TPR repeat protein
MRLYSLLLHLSRLLPLILSSSHPLILSSFLDAVFTLFLFLTNWPERDFPPHKTKAHDISDTRNVSDVIQAARKAASAARHYAKHGTSPPKSPAIANSDREIKEAAAQNQRQHPPQQAVVRARPLGYAPHKNNPEHLKQKQGRLPPPRSHGAPRVVVSPPSSSSSSSSSSEKHKHKRAVAVAVPKRANHGHSHSHANHGHSHSHHRHNPPEAPKLRKAPTRNHQNSKRNNSKGGPLLPGASQDIMDLLSRASALRNDSASFLQGKAKPRPPLAHPTAAAATAASETAIVPMPSTPPASNHQRQTNLRPRQSSSSSPNSPPPFAPTALSDAQIVANARAAANKGNPAAQFRMGVIAEKGKHGTTRDYGEALRWYSLAAGATPTPHAKALCNLGRMYQLGLGVEPSDAVAVRYFTRASEQGDPKATYNLAMCYRVGSGVDADAGQALAHLSKAAALGSKAASFHLGLTLERGDEDAGVKRDSKVCAPAKRPMVVVVVVVVVVIVAARVSLTSTITHTRTTTLPFSLFFKNMSSSFMCFSPGRRPVVCCSGRPGEFSLLPPYLSSSLFFCRCCCCCCCCCR